MVRPTEETRPMKPPITAPLVVQSFHSTDSSSGGKLADAATAKADAEEFLAELRRVGALED